MIAQLLMRPVYTLITLVMFIIAISVHECAHALAAYLLGDDTARKHGRLSLNPLVHIDPFGLLTLILIGIGWAKPVPMDERNFKYPALYSVMAAFAGPFANVIMIVVTLYLLQYMPIVNTVLIVQFALNRFVWLNALLAVFNLLPIPPLDGGHIIQAFMTREQIQSLAQFMPFILMGLIALLLIPSISQFFLRAVQGLIIVCHALVW